MKAHLRRSRWTPTRPDGPPACPGCGRLMTYSQPSEALADEVLGSCDNPACGEWVVWVRREDRWTVARRISAEERRNPEWEPARPATRATATR